MQNSGLGNSLNALLSLTNFYELGLFLLIGFRGRKTEEKIAAQIPMGEATGKLLSLINAETQIVENLSGIDNIKRLATNAYEGKITAALLTPGLWSEK